MNSISYKAKVTNPAIILSVSFLLIHIGMIIIFHHFHVTPMVYVNVFSILFYLSTFFMIKYRMARTYVLTVFLEVMIHMFLAVLCVGWNSGFQITMIGMVILGYYSEYAQRSMSEKFIPGLSLGLIALAFYINAFTFSYFFPAKYPLPVNAAYWFQILWGFIVFGIDIFFLEVFVKLTFKSERTLSFMVAHDRLTGLFSRYFMNEYLDRFLEMADKENNWIAIADIDDFKNVNDTYGHNCGDYVLETIGNLMKKELPEEIVCRWGGEEFLVFGKTEDGGKDAVKKLNKVRELIQNYNFSYEGHAMSVTITIGVCNYQNGRSIEDWVGCADKRLYEGKVTGKNKVVAESAD